METPARDLDEARIEAAIADILTENGSTPQDRDVADRPEFPKLRAADVPDPTEHQSVTAVLRQKWAEFSGAA